MFSVANTTFIFVRWQKLLHLPWLSDNSAAAGKCDMDRLPAKHRDIRGAGVGHSHHNFSNIQTGNMVVLSHHQYQINNHIACNIFVFIYWFELELHFCRLALTKYQHFKTNQWLMCCPQIIPQNSLIAYDRMAIVNVGEKTNYTFLPL